MIKSLLIVIALFSWHLSGGQPIIPRFENIGVNEGLPHSSVYSILQDKMGFMWFGTADGLCRYDGSELQIFKYRANNKQELVNNFVKGKMLEDKKGNIWYSNRSGIYKWDVVKEVVIRVRSFGMEEFNNSDFQSVYLDDKDVMWIFSFTKGLVAYNISNGKSRQYPLPYKIDYSKVLLTSSTVDDAGNIWIKIGPETDGYILFNNQSHTYSVQLADNPPHAIFFDKGRRILAYEDKLIYSGKGNGTDITIPKIINGEKISFYSFDGVSDDYGRLWMTARGNGLFYYDENKKIFKKFHHDNSKIKSLPFDLTTCLFIDRNQNLWIGIDGGGVARLDLKQPRFNLFPLSEGDFPILADYFTKCFYEDEKGRIWFGSQTNGLNIFDPNEQTLINYHHETKTPNSLPGNMVGCIIKDKENNIWVGSSGGISLFNEKKKSFETIPIKNLPFLYPLLNNLVYKIVQLRNGDLLAATIVGIIKIKKDENGRFKGNYFINNPSLCSVTTDVVEMPGDMIYATLPGLGLYQYKKDGAGYRMINSFLTGLDLRSVRKDEKIKGYLWIGSGKGLVHFNTRNNTYKVWDENDGMANSYVYGALEDSAGNLWISTNKGLSFFNRNNNHFDNYSYQDGLQSNEFNTQAIYKSNTGNFYFGGIKGFNWFSSGYVNKEIIQPAAAITRIEINDHLYEKDSSYILHNTLRVPYNKNDFSFKFAALDFTRPESNKVQYMLEGWDAAWITTLIKSVRYPNLPPGDYTLRLKVSNAAGIWSEEKTLGIFIQAPFWQRTWFLILMTLLILTIIILSTYSISQQKAKRKLRLLEKQVAVDAERDRISADMHDEIGSGITHIALLSELIQAQQKGETAFKKDINTIAVSARRLVQSMSEIIWALNPQNDTMENLLAYTREQSQLYFESMSVEFSIDFPDIIPKINLSNAQRRNLYLVTREALNNAMKHSEATVIKLTLDINGKEYCFKVQDNGKGISAKWDKRGNNGLLNMKKRMEDINGTIEWPVCEKGTLVRYCLTV
ncbi:MAG: two-component regulator propeller domain-containing protein [Bacteroidota bacterium]|nr:two-component regulator propeller domain-containing protein [Bacteroidota bacterium]